MSNFAFSYGRGRPYQLVPRSYVNGTNDRDFRVWTERGTVAYDRWRHPDWRAASATILPTPGAMIASSLNRRSQAVRPRGSRSAAVSPAFPSSRLGFARSRILQPGRPHHKLRREDRPAARQAWHEVRLQLPQRLLSEDQSRAPLISYTSRANLANIPTEVAPVFGSDEFRGVQKSLGFFAQDDWRIRRNLTLNIGLRYDSFKATSCPNPWRPRNTGSSSIPMAC